MANSRENLACMKNVRSRDSVRGLVMAVDLNGLPIVIVLDNPKVNGRNNSPTAKETQILINPRQGGSQPSQLSTNGTS